MRSSLQRLAALWLLLSACDRPPTWEQRIAPVLEASTARADAVPLPQLTATLPLASSLPMPRVLLHHGEAVLDLAPLASSVPPELASALGESAMPPPPLTFASVRDGVLALPPIAGRESPFGSALDEDALRRRDLRAVAVLAERGTPASVLVQLFEVLAVVGMERAELRFQRGDTTVAATFAPASGADDALVLAPVDGGLAVAEGRRWLAPDCRSAAGPNGVGIPLALPLDAPIRDPAAITRCLDVAHPSEVSIVVTDLGLEALGTIASGVLSSSSACTLRLIEQAPEIPVEAPGVFGDILGGGDVPDSVADVLAPTS